MPGNPPWVKLTVDGLLSAMTEREINDFGKVSTSASVPDRIQPVLDDLTQEIIGYIGSTTQNTLSADPALIPGEFKAKALAIARWRVLTAIPGYDPKEGRKLEYQAADTFFNNVAKGIIRPRPAPDFQANTIPSGKAFPSPKIHGRSKRFGRDQQDGI